MALPKEFSNRIPFDYLYDEEKHAVVVDFIGGCFQNIANKAEDKNKKRELLKYYNQWSVFLNENTLSDIKITNAQERSILDAQIVEFLETGLSMPVHLDEIVEGEANILTLDKYPFLFLENRQIPLVIDGGDFYKLFDIKGANADKFIDFCFDTGVFGNATADDIDVYLRNVDNYIEKFLYCIEEYLNINIVCLADSWKQQRQSRMLVSATVPNKRFLLDRPTRIIFKHADQWYAVFYMNMDDKSMSDYDELGQPHINRLKRLIEMEEEKEDKNKLAVVYEPSDIGRKLPMVELVVNNKPHKFLVGSTYNLYLTGERSILVGKIDIIQVSKEQRLGKANIRWVEGYPGLLD